MLSSEERLRVVRRSLDLSPLDPRSFAMLLREYADSADRCGGRATNEIGKEKPSSLSAQQPKPPAGRISFFEFFAPSSTVDFSPFLQRDALLTLAQRMEVDSMNRWSRIVNYPPQLKELQVRAWLGAWPKLTTRLVAVLAAAVALSSRPVLQAQVVCDCNGNETPDGDDLAGGGSLDCNGNGIPDECDIAPGSNFASPCAWATFDPGDPSPDCLGVGVDPDGYAGAVFDGVYVYFVPHYNGSQRHGEVLRFNTLSSFDDCFSWETYDAESHGYAGAAFDGRFIYFAPFLNSDWPSAHGEVLRYDTFAPFGQPSSWVSYDPGANGVGFDPDGYHDAVFDGRYVYFAPYYNGTEYHGEVLRYDTLAPFEEPASWATLDPGASCSTVGSDPDGYVGAVFDGRYVYFAPNYNGTEYHGEVLRHDTHGPFGDCASWEAYDAGANGIGIDPDGFDGAVFDGRYVYFAPYYNGTDYHAEVLRFDTLGLFQNPTSWATFEPQQATGGYEGNPVFDGRYVYFVPHSNGTAAHGEVLRYDTLAPFEDLAAWATFDAGDNGVGNDPDGYIGAAFDGRHGCPLTGLQRERDSRRVRHRQ
jgi:hypothetical protein